MNTSYDHQQMSPVEFTYEGKSELKLIHSQQVDDIFSSYQIFESQASKVEQQQFQTIGNSFYQFIAEIKNQKTSARKFQKLKKRVNFCFENPPSIEEIICLFEKLRKQSHEKLLMNNCSKWTLDHKILFQWIVLQYLVKFHDLDSQSWEEIASYLPFKTLPTQCKKLWYIGYKTNAYDYPWSLEEDQALLDIVSEFQSKGMKSKWTKIANNLQQKYFSKYYRTPKQCRERWGNKLDPEINRDPWQKEDDIEFLYLILENGKKWARLTKLMTKKRTEFALKHKFLSLLQMRNQNQCEEKELLKKRMMDCSLISHSLGKDIVEQILDCLYVLESTEDLQSTHQLEKFQDKRLGTLGITLNWKYLDGKSFESETNLAIVNQKQKKIIQIPNKYLKELKIDAKQSLVEKKQQLREMPNLSMKWNFDRPLYVCSTAQI